jgi:hypothetical protein
MSDAKKYYCFCSSNCKYETMTKEQILAAIAQAVETGTIQDVDAGFITKVKEGNAGEQVKFWVGTKAQHNALESIDEDCVYIITDGSDFDDLLALASKMAEDMDNKVDKRGDSMKGALTLKGVVLTEGVDYGDDFPTTGLVKGRRFLKRVIQNG